ncbi:MAG: hypothetical protein ACK4PR_04775, partial [Gammaproteobacteria bacterium]
RKLVRNAGSVATTIVLTQKHLLLSPTSCMQKTLPLITRAILAVNKHSRYIIPSKLTAHCAVD